MRHSTIACLMTGAALLAGCNTVRGAAADVDSVAATFDPNATYTPCGSTLLDANADGRISDAEWNTYRAGGYASWDANHDGRIGRRIRELLVQEHLHQVQPHGVGAELSCIRCEWRWVVKLGRVLELEGVGTVRPEW